MTDPSVRPPAGATAVSAPDPTLGALVNDLTTQVPELIRSELRLAQAEMTEKGKRAGIGIGMFSGAGLMAFFGFGTLLATLILVLDLFLPAWLAALIVTVVLFAIAGILAMMGKKKVDQATPLAPVRAQAGVKEDIATVKGQRA
ncbi:MAG: phage holin family protein [Marmoricola sp.]|nr:phage holin family protein [Marmoricola sp.]